jgi:hypothetical protein
MQAVPGQEKALEATLLSLAEMAGSTPGCLGAQPLRDAGNAARFVLVEKWESVDAYTAAVAGFSRETGGFGGPPGKTSGPLVLPMREPDIVVELPTRPESALIYRLSGDDIHGTWIPTWRSTPALRLQSFTVLARSAWSATRS